MESTDVVMVKMYPILKWVFRCVQMCPDVFRVSNPHKEFSKPEQTREGQEEDIVSKYYKLTLMLMDTITLRKQN